MPVINWVKVKTFLQMVGDAPTNYIPIAALLVDNGDAPDGFSSPAVYSSTGEMLDAGWSASSKAALAVAQLFGQGSFTITPPTRVVVIERASPVAQVEEFTITSTTDGVYKLFVGPVGGLAVEAATFTASSNSETEIKDGLILAFNNGPFGATHTAASSDTASGTITADIPGVPFVLTATVPDGATATAIANDTPNSGVFEDLETAWRAQPFWAVIPDPSEPEGVMLEVGRWAELSAEENSERRNVALLQTTDSDILSASEPNFASTLVGLNYTRSFALLHANNSDKMTAAWFGRYGGQFPGSRAWHFGRLAGSSVTTGLIYSQSQIENVKTQRCAVVQRDGPSVLAPLRVNWDMGAGGAFIQQKQAEDYAWLRWGQALVGQLESIDGLAQDPDGVNKLIAAINEVNDELGTNNPPVIDLARTVVRGVPLDQVPDAETARGDYYTTGGIIIETVLIPRMRSVAASAGFALV